MTEIIPLTAAAEWEEIWEEIASDDAFLRLIFKASPRCPISRGAEAVFRGFVSGLDEVPDLEVRIVDVIASREVSNRIASDTGVKHESPQALLLGPGREVLWHAGHIAVSERNLSEALASARG